jgi:hypothetical protein
VKNEKPTVVSRMIDLAAEACTDAGTPATSTGIGSCLLSVSAMVAIKCGMNRATFVALAMNVYDKAAKQDGERQ